MSDILSGIANITKTVTSTFNSYEFRKLGDKVQGMVMNYSEAEMKVREATNEDPWGPTGPQMAEIAQLTYQYDSFPEVMNMLWKRMLHDNHTAWRRVYKSLTLLHYLLKHGSERVVNNARDHLFEMRSLESYKFISSNGKDEGLNVRHRAKLLFDLIQDEEQLKLERRKAKSENKDKYQGYSRDDMKLGNHSIRSRNINDFDDWKKEKESGKSFNSFEEIDRGVSNREVNSFQFPDDDLNNGDDSPELGIRQHSREPSPPAQYSREQKQLSNAPQIYAGDDDFGDFAQACNVDAKSSPHSQIFRLPGPPSPCLQQQFEISSNAASQKSNIEVETDIKASIDKPSNDLFDLTLINFDANAESHKAESLLDSSMEKSLQNWQSPAPFSAAQSEILNDLSPQNPILSINSDSVLDSNSFNYLQKPSCTTLTPMKAFETQTHDCSIKTPEPQNETEKDTNVLKIPSTWSELGNELNINIDDLLPKRKMKWYILIRNSFQ